MRGHIDQQPNLYVQINLEDLVPADHPLRPIKRMADEALAAMSRTLTSSYASKARGGRPSVPPEQLLKAMLLMSLYTIRSERALCERITFDMLFRWFLDMTPDEPCFDHSVFSLNRKRLHRLRVTKKFSDRIVLAAYEAGLLSEDHFSIDGSLLQSHASLKSLKHMEELRRLAEERDDDEDEGSGQATTATNVGNPWVSFRGEKRSNKTHRSTTDREARLYTKTSGVAYLQHTMHVLMENRHGIGVDILVGKADGFAERKCCLKMLDRVRKKLEIEPKTLGADKGYDMPDFLPELEERKIKPHIACKSDKRIDVKDEADIGLMARRVNQRRRRNKGYQVSQRKRKLDEEIFGWLKQYGGLRRARVCGRWKIQQCANMALSALNLIRITRLLAT
jgi:transposase